MRRRIRPKGREWIERLPSLVHALARKWHLNLSSEAAVHGANALVAFATRSHDDDPCAIRVDWHAALAAEHAEALRIWDGRGMVRLFDADVADGALLLERLDHRRSLQEVDLLQAAAVGGALIRELATDAPQGFAPKSVAGYVDKLPERQDSLGDPIPAAWVGLGDRLASELLHTAGSTLIHSDLHYRNVLAGTRHSWLAIDPRPHVGDPERSVPELLWWRNDMSDEPDEIRTLLNVIVTSGALDADKARGWVVVRSLDHWLWAIEEDIGDGQDRCRHILEALT